MRDSCGEIACGVVRTPRRLEGSGEFGGRLTDDVGRSDVAWQVAGERAEVLSLERAAENEVNRSVVVRSDPASGGGGVGRLRVVDPADAAELSHELEPVRHAGKGAERVGDRLVRDAGGTGGSRRRGCVLAVVAAGDAGLGRKLVVGGELDSAYAEAAWHDLGARPLEDAELCVAVRLKAAMAVDVVGLEVEKDGDVAGEGVDILKLEARELAHDPRVRPCLLRGGCERPADVAGDLGGTAVRAENCAEELGRRCLPVRSGHADEARPGREEPVAELDLAPERDAASVRGGGQRRISRHAGTLDDEVHTLEQRLLLPSEVDFDARVAEPPRVDAWGAVGGDGGYAAPRERESGRLAGTRKPDHERTIRQPCPREPRRFGTCPAHSARTPPPGGGEPLRSG